MQHQLELSYAALLCPVRMFLGTYRLAGGCWEDIGVEQREDALVEPAMASQAQSEES
jgi:hypothetical protein